jgi:hypothetical protein|nr:hypothetical protein [Paraglaciecola sp. MB-3u-78]
MDKTTSKGTIQGYNGIAINDDKSLGMTTRFTADSGLNSEDNLAFMSSSGFDTYIADTQFRSRNPLFKESETYHTEKDKRRHNTY